MSAKHQVHVLTESSTAAIPLSVREAAALNELGKSLASKKRWWGDDDEKAEVQNKSVIRCSPRADGRWDVLVHNAVGIIGVDGADLFVQPKIPVNHAVHLFSYSDQFPRFADPAVISQLAEGDLLWHAMARWFIGSVEKVLRGELIKDYRSVQGEVREARGRINVLATTQKFLSGSLDFSCEYDEFDADNSLNRILKASLSAILRISGLDDSIRSRSARALLRFNDVGSIRPTDLRVVIDRHSVAYSEAVALGKNILLGIARSLEAGHSRTRAFLLRTPDLIESGIRALLHRALSPVCSVLKGSLRIKDTSMTLNPDLVFRDAAIGDVKYKLSSDWNRADLYQGVSFAVGYGVRRCAIVGFTGNAKLAIKSVKIGDIEVTSLQWPTGTSPQNAQSQLEENILGWLGNAGSVPASI